MLIYDPDSSEQFICDPSADDLLIYVPAPPAAAITAGCARCSPLIRGVVEFHPMTLLMRNDVGVWLVGAEADIEGEETLLTETVTIAGEEYDVVCVASVLLKESMLPIAGGDGLPMTYAGVPGKFRGVLPHSLPLIEETLYVIRVQATIDTPTNIVAEWECVKVAVPRDCSRRC
ncbi:hypothetical protein [Anatilimnocola floriformis]|uniref:hypothetical protein n=1 Tax=Anatilimnocola floriformis TaxID=2948575 RepID=UPI0020C42F51|nr:hypothetical protein [Anatilimnocola floriformis]